MTHTFPRRPSSELRRARASSVNSRTGPSPKLSIITAVFNRVDHLESCLESVAMQRAVTIQHIVIDGGSTDGSVDILRRWSGRIDAWISEPENGRAHV